MIWLVVIILAGLYLFIRIVQMTHYLITNFFLADTISLSIKAIGLFSLSAVAFVARLCWKYYTKPRQPSQRQ